MNKEGYIHPQAIVESKNIGHGTNIWAFSHIQRDVKIGSNCNIGEGCFIENGVIVGNDVVIKNNISIWNGITIEDNVFLGPNVVLTNDLYPRAKIYHNNIVKTIIKVGASIGANATIICGITIGQYSLIGAGSVITKDIPDYALYFGNPAEFKNWICICTKKIFFENDKYQCKCGKSYLKENDNTIRLIKD